MGGKSVLVMYAVIRATRGAEKGGRGGIGRGLGVRTLSGRYINVLRDPLYRILWSSTISVC